MATPSFVFSPRYEADIGPHVFPTFKYRRVRERLLEFGVSETAIVEPAPGTHELLALVHGWGYLNEFLNLESTPATLSSELPLTREIVEWFELAVYGSVTAARLAGERGAAMHIGGGFHHAFADHAEGFCYLNDIAVAARAALGDADAPPIATRRGPVKSVSVVDLDVHQGNGTARIFQGDDRVFTLSLHQENNYPVKERGDRDFGLPDGMEDEAYLEVLDRGLTEAVRERAPELVIYVAGADPYRDDLLGGLHLSQAGLRERDARVFEAAKKAGAAVMVCLAGGYAADPEDTVTIHFQAAQELLARWPVV